MAKRSVEAAIPHSSPVPPILFEIYTSMVKQQVPQRVSTVNGLCFVDDVRWMPAGSNIPKTVRNLEACARENIGLVDSLEMDFAKTKIKPALCMA